MVATGWMAPRGTLRLTVETQMEISLVWFWHQFKQWLIHNRMVGRSKCLHTQRTQKWDIFEFLHRPWPILIVRDHMWRQGDRVYLYRNIDKVWKNYNKKRDQELLPRLLQKIWSSRMSKIPGVGWHRKNSRILKFDRIPSSSRKCWSKETTKWNIRRVFHNFCSNKRSFQKRTQFRIVLWKRLT